jgi:hypothetical protein
MSKHTIEVEVTGKMLADTITTALEGASNYWLDLVEKCATFRSSREERNDHGPWYAVPRYWDGPHVTTFFELTDECNGTTEAHIIGPMQIAAGLDLMSKKSPTLFNALLSCEDNPLDSSDADCVLQWIVLGELRYG